MTGTVSAGTAGRRPPPESGPSDLRKSVLVLGVYLARHPNHIRSIVRELGASRDWKVQQRWVGIGGLTEDYEVRRVSEGYTPSPIPKFSLINQLLQTVQLQQTEYIVLVDDDIELPAGFLDTLLAAQQKLDFRIAQPARTANSYIDHPIVQQEPGAFARETRFVEVGPVVSIHRSVFEVIVPFDLTSPMGWGYENVWAHELSRLQLKMGIIDACPVDHSLREPHEHYSWQSADSQRLRLLELRAHLPLEDCQRVLATHYSEARAVPPAPAGTVEDLPFGVNLAGHLHSEKGVGEGARAMLRCLSAAKVPVALNDYPDHRSANTEPLPFAVAADNPFAINLIHIGAKHHPEFVASRTPAYFAGRYNIGYWAWELPRFPDEWLSSLDWVDEVWVPSEFVATALAAHARIPVVRIPHALESPARTPPFVRSDLGLPEGYLFLFMFDAASAVSRKNPNAVIEAFTQAFAPADPAVLVIKCLHSELAPNLPSELHCPGRDRQIVILDGLLTRERTLALISLCDCFVSLHRSEGFGLALAEAMARSKPVIATAYSGNMDFMNEANSLLVRHKLEEIQRSDGDYAAGEVWAAPDIGHAAELMRWVCTFPERAAAIGRAAAADISRQLSPDTVGKLAAERLRAIHEGRSAYKTKPWPRQRWQTAGKSQAPDCSVIIPVYNHSELTRQCLDALLAQEYRASSELIVVDDGSHDDTPRVLAAYGNRIRVVRQKTNCGFAITCNTGAAAARSDLLLFLNNDTIPHGGWLDNSLACLEEDDQIGIVGSKLLYPDGSIQHAGVVICADNRPRHIYAGFPASHPAVNKSRSFQIVTGACMLVRRNIFERLAGFDTHYVNSFEDVDLCLRAREQGVRIHYCHRSVLTHLESATRVGRTEEELRNFRRYDSVWGHRVTCDEFTYYVADGLLNVLHTPTYPLEFHLDPLFARAASNTANASR